MSRRDSGVSLEPVGSHVTNPFDVPASKSTKNMSTIEIYQWLEKIADDDSCDGLCGTAENRFIKCRECWSKSLLNYVCNMLHSEKSHYDNDNIVFSVPVKELPYPVCKPALGTHHCGRCGSDVKGKYSPCKAVPQKDRWQT